MGFDVNKVRASELAQARRTGGVTDEEFAAVRKLTFTAETEALRDCNVYIVTVPTPIDQATRPDLTALMRASEIVGGASAPAMSSSTSRRYIPAPPRRSASRSSKRRPGLAYNKDFFVGYSPERINPGDPQTRLPNIKKITSGSTPAVADLVDAVYGLDHPGRDPPAQLDQRSRGGQGHRKHPARLEYRPCQ